MAAGDVAVEIPAGSDALTDGGRSRRRERVALEIVDLADAAGFIIPPSADGSAAYRGWGDTDYACGNCGALLCIGVRPGLFRTLLFSCACGVLNRIR